MVFARLVIEHFKLGHCLSIELSVSIHPSFSPYDGPRPITERVDFSAMGRTPVIPALGEADAGSLHVRAQPRQLTELATPCPKLL